jgi:hypothetical protein
MDYLGLHLHRLMFWYKISAPFCFFIELREVLYILIMHMPTQLYRSSFVFLGFVMYVCNILYF